MTTNADAPRKRGRPSEYREEYAEQAEKLCRLVGATDAQLAAFFGKAESCINAWKLAHPEFAAAIRRGKVISDLEVNTSLYRRANWHEYTEQQAIKVKEVEYVDGKRAREIERVELVEVKRVLPPCTTAMIFWHKNRQPEHWRDKREVEHSGVITHEQALAQLESAIDGDDRARDEPGGARAPAQTRH